MIFRTKHKLDFTPMACDAKYVLSARPASELFHVWLFSSLRRSPFFF